MFRPLFAETWRGLGDDHTVVRRDLHREPLPHLTDAARLRVDGEASDAAAEKLQAELIAEVAAADVVVIGAPMYNWSLPSTLKAWIDYIHVLGTTVPFDNPDRIDITKLTRMTKWMYSTGRAVGEADKRPAVDPNFKLERCRDYTGDYCAR